MNEGFKSLDCILTELGFERLSGEIYTLKNKEVLDINNQQELGALERIEVKVAHGGWQCQLLELTLNLSNFKKVLAAKLEQKFHNLIQVDLVDNNEGSFWLIMEFSENLDSKSLKESFVDEFMPTLHGAAGMLLSFHTEGDLFSLCRSHHFFLGKIPEPTFEKIPAILGETFGIAIDDKHSSAHEIFFSPVQLALSFLTATDQQNRLREYQDHKFETSCKINVVDSNIKIYLDPSPAFQDLQPPPIEVMEEREDRQSLHEIDNFILREENREALNQCQQRSTPIKPEIIRRMCLLDFHQRDVIDPGLIHRALAQEPGNLFYRSIAVSISTNPTEGLTHLSELGRQLKEEVPRFSSVRSLELVLPECLSDAWRHIDLEKSNLCLKRITHLREVDSHLLLKSSLILRSLGFKEEEADTLRLALSLISDSELQAELRFRLAQIYFPQDLPKSLKYAKEALHNNSRSAEIALFLAQLLIRDDDALQAISVLDNAVRSLQTDVDNYEQSNEALLELKAGEIWLEKLNRPDISQKRFERVLELAKQDQVILESLLTHLNKISDWTQKARILESLLQLATKKESRQEAEIYFKKLQEIIPQTSAGRATLVKMIHFFIQHFPLAESQHLEFLESNLELEWEFIYDRLEDQLNGPFSHRDALYLILARVAQEKLKRPEKAIFYFKKIHETSHLSLEHLKTLVNLLTAEDRIAEVIELLKERLAKGISEETQWLIEILCQYKDYLNPIEHDELAVELLSISDELDLETHKRLLYYESEGNAAGIDRLLSLIEQKFEDLAIREKWLESGIASLKKMKSPEAYQILDKIFTKQTATTLDTINVLNRAIIDLKNAPDSELATPYIVRLITAGILPDLPEGDVIERLRGMELELGLYYELRYRSEHENSPKYARNAWSCFRKISGLVEHEIEAISHVSESDILSFYELQRCEELAVRLDRWQWYYHILLGQFDKASNIENQKELTKKVIHYAKNMNLTSDQILNHHTFLIQRTRAPEEFIFALADYGMSHFKGEAALPYICFCFDEYNTWLFPKQMAKVLEFSIMSIADSEIFKRKLIERATEYAESNIDLYLKYEPLLLKHQLMTKNLLWRSLEYHCKLNQLDSAQVLWQLLISSIDRIEDAWAFILDSKRVFSDAGKEETYLRLLRQGISEPKDGNQTREIWKEIQLLFALQLFEFGEPLSDYMKFIEDRFNELPDDHRTWLPLYFSYKEQNSDKLYDLLSFTVPKLRKNNRILRNFPVTLESLETELAKRSTPDSPETAPVEPVAQPQPNRGFKQKGSRKRPVISLPKAHTKTAEVDLIPSAHYSNSNDFPGNQATAEDTIDVINPADSRLHDVATLVALRKSGIVTTAIKEGQFFLEQPAILREMLYAFKDYQFPRSSTGLTFIDRGIDDAILGQFSIIQNSTLFERELTHIASDWRSTVRSLAYSPGMTEKIISTAFEKKLDKHIAVQCFALISGEMDLLGSWSLQPWRNPSKVNYSFDARKRLNKQDKDPLLNGHLHNLLSQLRPVMIDLHRHRFSADHIGKKVNLSGNELINARKPLRWSDTFFQDNGLAIFTNALNKAGFVVFSLRGLGPSIYFDYRHRAIYFDGKHYKAKPPSFLFYRILIVIKSIMHGFYPILKLHPERHLLPLINQTKDIVRNNAKQSLSMGIIKKIGRRNSDLEKSLQELDLVRLSSLFTRVGFISLNRIKKLQMILWKHLYQMQVAETLDIVGLTESIVGQDLMINPPAPKEIISLSRYVSPILEIATKLNLDNEDEVDEEDEGY